jgi:hypothetical protein
LICFIISIGWLVLWMLLLGRPVSKILFLLLT